MVVANVRWSLCGCALPAWMPGGSGEPPQATGGGVSTHLGAAAIEQDRSVSAACEKIPDDFLPGFAATTAAGHDRRVGGAFWTCGSNFLVAR
jgi:hypothetical protein